METINCEVCGGVPDKIHLSLPTRTSKCIIFVVQTGSEFCMVSVALSVKAPEG